MILRNKVYERRAPSRDAILIIIYCEGKKREPHYFGYFNEISSQIKFEIVEAKHDSNNSPTGLYEQAQIDLIKNENNTLIKYEITDEDHVWFVIDTDRWGDKIIDLRLKCLNHQNWHIAQSNPCFEVWLYYHIRNERPCFEEMNISKNWKTFLNNIISGGFNSKKHPIFIKDAIENAKKNFSTNSNHEIDLCSTEVYLLAESFYPFVKDIIEDEYIAIKENCIEG
jgi:hypothetical protein